MLLHLFRRLRERITDHSLRSARPRDRLRKWYHPRLELLEDRITPSVVVWNAGPGDWSNANNWLDTTTGTQHVPGPNDVAEITADVTVTHSTGVDIVQDLVLYNPFILSGGSLRVISTLIEQNANLFSLQGGVLSGADVAAGTTIVGTNLGGTLDGVTLDGVLDLATNNNAIVNVTGGLTLNSTIDIGAADGSTFDTLAFAGAQATVSTTSSGSIVFGGSPFNSLVIPAPGFGIGTTLTISAGVTIDGQSGVIGTGTPAESQTTVGGTLVNYGTIAADAAGAPSTTTPPGALTIASAVFTNHQALQVTSGETLNIGRAPPAPSTAWDNSSGTIGVASGTLNLNGTVSAFALGTFNRTGGTVNLVGTLNSDFETGLVLDHTTGTWNLKGGIINGGTITTNGSTDDLRAAGLGYYGDDTLNGVTLDGVLDLATITGAAVNITGGLILNGTIDIGAADGSTLDALAFVGSQAVSTTSSGTIVFGASIYNSLVIPVTTPTATTLTVNPGITIDGQTGVIGTGLAAFNVTTTGGNLINHGTIAADAAGAPTVSTPPGTLTFVGAGLTNAKSGVLEASKGETLSIGRGPTFADTTWTNSGTLSVDGGATLNLNGVSWSNTGTISFTNNSTVNLGSTFTLADLGTFNRSGGTVNLIGTLTNNSAAGLVLDGTTGTWNLKGGIINGGTITTNGSTDDLRAAGLGYYGDDTLNGVTLDGVLDLATFSGAAVNITGGLILNGTIDIGAADGSTPDALAFVGSQAVSTSSSGAIVFGASIYNSLVIPVTTPTATTLTVNPGITIDGQTGIIGTGLAAFNETTAGGNLVNHGTIAADAGGTLTVMSATNFAAATGTLTGGTWKAIGTSILRLLGANIVTNAATIVLDGSGAHFFSDNNTTNALAGLTTNAVTGTFTIQNGANLTTGAFSNQGSVIVGPGSTFTTPTFTNGGSLAGSGTVAANVVNNGKVSPGMSPGILSITGNYTQSSAGSLNMELAGTTPGTQYDQLKISGSATLDGTLNVLLLNGFQPASGDSFLIMTFGSVSGDFATENGLSVAGGLELSPVYAPSSNATSLSLVTMRDSITWTAAGSGDWGTDSNWTDNQGVHRLPGTTDDVVIPTLNSGAVVTHSTGTDTVNSISASAPINLSGGALIVTSMLQDSSPFTLMGGTLSKATVVAGTTITATGGTLDGLTLGATVGGVAQTATVDEPSGNAFITGGLTFANGSVFQVGSASFSGGIQFQGDETVGGTGEFRFEGASIDGINSFNNLTFGAGLLIHGTNAAITMIGGSIVNGATIESDGGGNIGISGNPGTTLTNAAGGQLVAAGGTLTLGGVWSNAGQIVENNSTLNLGGRFTTAGLGTYTRSGGAINLTGFLDNTGATLVLDAITGSWNLTSSGTLHGGALVTTGGAALIVAGGTLDGLTLGGTVGGVAQTATVDEPSGNAFITGGLTFVNGSVFQVGSASFSGGIQFQGDETVGGTGEFRFEGASIDGINSFNNLTFGAGLLIHGTNAAITMIGGSIVNGATIESDGGGTIAISGNPGTTLTNAAGGQLVAAGGTLTLGGVWSNAGQIVENNSTLNLGGRFTTAGLGTYTRSGGAINLTGFLDNTGATLVLDATTGSWNLTSGGTLHGGALVTTGGAALIVAGGTLDGLTLGGTVGGVAQTATVDEPSGNAFITGGLTFVNGSVFHVGSASFSGGIQFQGDEAVGGTGEFRFEGASIDGINSFNNLTFGAGLLIHGTNAAITMIGGSIVNGATIESDGGGNIGITGNAGTTLTNGAGGQLVADGGTLTLGGVWSNSGTIQAQNGGTVVAQGSLTNFSAGTLTGGTWKVFDNSTLRFTNVDIATNAATVLLDGPNSHLDSFNSSTGQTTPALAQFAANAATGTFTIQNGRDVTPPGDFNNAGALILGPASTFSVTGSYTQGSAAALETDLGGSPVSGQFGQLKAAGTAALDGTLNVSVINGVQPTSGDSFLIMTFGSVSGDFATENGLSVAGGLELSPVYAPSSNATSLSLVVSAGPVANSDTFTTDINTQLHEPLSSVLGNDTGTGLRPMVVTTTTDGTLFLNSDGLTYTPNNDFTGTDSFTYRDEDANGIFSNTVTDYIIVGAQADLQVTIGAVTPSPGISGQPYSYTVTLTNVGPQDATNVVLLETTDAGAHLYSVTTAGVITEDSLNQDSIAFARLAANTSVTAIIGVVASNPGTYTDTVSATADQTNPRPADATKTVTETVVAARAALQVSISAVMPSPALTGQPYTYTITLTNAGPQDATNVVLLETTDAGAHLYSVTTAGVITEDSLNQDSIAFASVAANTSVTAIIGVVASNPGTYTDTVSATADQTNPRPADATKTVTETVVAAQADLQVSISPVTPSPGVTGQPYSYTITLTNAGPQDATNVVLLETTDSGAHLFSVTTAGVITEKSLNQDSIAFARLAANTSVTAIIGVVASNPGTYTDTASATADQTNPRPADATATVTETVIAPTADLQVKIGAVTPSPALTGQPYSYTITLTNAGPQDATNVVLLEMTDAGARLFSVTTAGVITEDSPTQDSIAFARLAANTSVTATIAVVASNSGTYTDTVSATADQTNPRPADATATVTEVVDLASRTFLVAPVTWVVGKTVVFTAIVKPAGPAVLTPTGQVIFTVDGKAQAPVNLVGAVAYFITSTLSSASDNVRASYQGDGSFADSNSITLGQTSNVKMQVNGESPQLVEGTSFTGTVASFTTNNKANTAADFTAVVNWGDGTTSDGTIGQSAGPVVPASELGKVQARSLATSAATSAAASFTVAGNHTYLDAGSFMVTVTVTDLGSGTATTSQFSAVVQPVAGLVLEDSSGHNMSSLAVQSFSWGEALPLDSSGQPTGRVTRQDVRFDIPLSSASPQLFQAVGTDKSFRQAIYTLPSEADQPPNYSTWTFTNVVLSGYSTAVTPDGGATEEVTLHFGKATETYRPLNTDGTLGQGVQTTIDFTSTGESAIAPAAARPPATSAAAPGTISLTLDGVKWPLSNALVVQSFSWGEALPFNSAGQVAGKVTRQDVRFDIPLSMASPLLVQAVDINESFRQAVFTFQSGGDQPQNYLTWTFTNAALSSYSIAADPNGGAVEEVTLHFGKATEAYQSFNADGTVVQQRSASIDFTSARESVFAPAAATPPTTSAAAPGTISLTLNGALWPTSSALAVQSFSWGEALPRDSSGQVAGKVTRQDVRFDIPLSMASPLLVQAVDINESFTQAVFTFQSGGDQPQNYLTWTFTNAALSSYSIAADPNGGTVEEITLHFGKATEAYQSFNADGTVVQQRSTSIDFTSARELVIAPAAATPPATSGAAPGTISLTLNGVLWPATANPLAVESFSWGEALPRDSSGHPTGRVALQDVRFDIPLSMASPLLVQAVDTNESFLHAVFAFQSSGDQPQNYLTWTFTNAALSSYSIGASPNGGAVEEITLHFGKATEAYQSFNTDGTLGQQRAASIDFTSARESVIAPAAATPPATSAAAPGTILLTLNGVKWPASSALVVQSFSWGEALPRDSSGQVAGRVTLQDVRFDIPLSMASPLLVQAVDTNESFTQAVFTFQSGGVQPQNYLTWTFTNAVLSGYSTAVSPGGGGAEELTLHFGKATEQYQSFNTDGTVVQQRSASIDFTSARESAIAPAAATPPATSAAVPGTILLTLNGVKWPASSALAVQSFSWGEALPFNSAGQPAGKVTRQDVRFDIPFGMMSPLLFQAVGTNESFTHAVFTFQSGGDQPRTYLTWTFTDVVLSSYRSVVAPGGGAVDQLTLHFGKATEEYTPLNSDGTPGTPIETSIDFRGSY